MPPKKATVKKPTAAKKKAPTPAKKKAPPTKKVKEKRISSTSSEEEKVPAAAGTTSPRIPELLLQHTSPVAKTISSLPTVPYNGDPVAWGKEVVKSLAKRLLWLQTNLSRVSKVKNFGGIQHHIQAAATAVPYGTACSYGTLVNIYYASPIGRMDRRKPAHFQNAGNAVNTAKCPLAPFPIPTHRIVPQTGKITDPNAAIRVAMLKCEDIPVENDVVCAESIITLSNPPC